MNADLNKALASRHTQQKKQSVSEEAPNEANEKGSTPRQTFLSLHLRLQRLLIHALDSESDPQGMQFLLSGLGTLLQDTVSFEKEVLKKQKLASEQQKDSEPPCLGTSVEENEDTEVQVSDDQPKGEGQLEEKGQVPEVIVTRSSVTQEEEEGGVLSRPPLRGVKETANTESLLEEGFSECDSVLVYIFYTSVPCPACCIRKYIIIHIHVYCIIINGYCIIIHTYVLHHHSSTVSAIGAVRRSLVNSPLGSLYGE